MADEREGAPQPKPDAATPERGGAERRPGPPDEQRSFKPAPNPGPRNEAGDAEGLLGPRGDPAEGKR